MYLFNSILYMDQRNQYFWWGFFLIDQYTDQYYVYIDQYYVYFFIF